MTKELFFIGFDGKAIPVTVSDVPFDDNGVNRIKFEVKDPFSTSMIQRLDGDNWIRLEGDILEEYVPRIGAVIRKNFDT